MHHLVHDRHRLCFSYSCPSVEPIATEVARFALHLPHIKAPEKGLSGLRRPVQRYNRIQPVFDPIAGARIRRGRRRTERWIRSWSQRGRHHSWLRYWARRCNPRRRRHRGRHYSRCRYSGWRWGLDVRCPDDRARGMNCCDQFRGFLRRCPQCLPWGKVGGNSRSSTARGKQHCQSDCCDHEYSQPANLPKKSR